MVPLWLSTPSTVLKRAFLAASSAAFLSAGFTVLVRLLMLVRTTCPAGLTTMVTTTLPSSCILYTGAGKPPSPSERPFRSKAPFHPTPVVFRHPSFRQYFPAARLRFQHFLYFPFLNLFQKLRQFYWQPPVQRTVQPQPVFGFRFLGFLFRFYLFLGFFLRCFLLCFFRGFFSFLGFSFFGSSFLLARKAPLLA